MSTYTDLHNRIKENLTILRKPGSKDDGMSPQKVILINPENQFYGTFNGAMNITSGTLSGLKIVDSELENVDLGGATIDGVSLGELKATVDVNTQDIEQLTADAKTISAAHDELSVGLSGAVDTLRSDVNDKLDQAVKDSIGGVVSDVGTLSTDLSTLSVKVETLSSSMLNGVVYRGSLTASQDIYHTVGEFFQKMPSCCLLDGSQRPLTNGWMWRVTIDRENVPGLYCIIEDPNTGLSCMIGEGDYVIIKNHLPEVYQVIPDSKMQLNDMDIINAQNEDDVAVELLCTVSSYLSGKIDETLLSAKNFTNEVSRNLSNLLVDKIAGISAETLAEAKSYTDASALVLSTFLSNILSTYSNELCSCLSNRVDEEYVHRAGDTITKLSVEDVLSVAGKTVINHDFGVASGTELEVSKNKVELKTFAPLTLSTTNDTKIAAHTLSIYLENNDDGNLAINGQPLKDKLDAILKSANAYTDTSSKILIEHIETRLDKVSSDTKTEANQYSDKLSDAISSATNARLSALSNDLTAYSDKLSTQISTTVKTDYIHKAGDSIKKLSVEGDLSVAGKTVLDKGLKFNDGSGTYTEFSTDGVSVLTRAGVRIESNDKISLKTTSSINETADQFIGIFQHGTEITSNTVKLSTDNGLASVVVNGKSVQSTLEELSGDLERRKLDITLAKELSSKLALSDDIDWNLTGYINGPGYLVSSDLSVNYDKDKKRIYLLVDGKNCAEIDTTDFIKDGMLSGANYLPGGHSPTSTGPEIELIFNTDAGKDPIYIPVDKLVDVYKASGDGLSLDIDNTFRLDYPRIKEAVGVNEISTSLYGTIDEKGWLKTLQEQITNVSSDVSGDMFLAGHLQPAIGPSSFDSLCAFFKSCDGFDRVISVKNGATYNVIFKDPEVYNIGAVTIKTASGEISVGNGDVVVIHNHTDGSESIFLSDLVYDGNKDGNTYLLKAGVSRYEFEHEAKSRFDDDHFISSWIEQNFANTKTESAATTTIFKQHVSADQDLRVAGDVEAHNDLYVGNTLTTPNASVSSLSASSFSELFAPIDGELCSVADLCASLNADINSLSTSLSTDISSLTVKMQEALSALDKDPLSNLTNNSKISTVISAVVEIRDMLNALRDVWKSFVPPATEDPTM